MKKYVVSALVVAAGVLSAGRSSADQLVTNGGFETGDFTGWTLSGNTGFTNVVSFNTHSGNYAASFGPVGSTGMIEQTQLLDTVAGQTYDFSFWLLADGGTPNSFSASFDGTEVLSISNTNGFAYTLFDFSVVATTNQTALSFTYRHDPAFYYLDDVSVIGTRGVVPEPASAMLLGLGSTGMLAAYRRKRRKSAAHASA